MAPPLVFSPLCASFVGIAIGQESWEMSNYDLRRFRDAEDLAQSVASDLIHWFASAKSRRCIALSGGRIAGRFYEALRELSRTEDSWLDLAEFFWSDERCVPPDDRESNFRLAWEDLLGPLQVPEGKIHRIRGELEPARAAYQAEDELRKLATSNVSGQPVLDLALLGMGEDGHVASLFPGESEAVVNHPAVFRSVRASKPPPMRITMGFPVLAAAREVWVLASGAGKEEALSRSLAAGGTTPLARLISLRPATRIRTDIRI